MFVLSLLLLFVGKKSKTLSAIGILTSSITVFTAFLWHFVWIQANTHYFYQFTYPITLVVAIAVMVLMAVLLVVFIRRSGKTLPVIIPLVLSILIVGASVFYMNNVVKPKYLYDSAIAKMNDGDYEAAFGILDSLNGFSDSEDKMDECNYHIALKLMENKKYLKAKEVLAKLDGYEGVEEQVAICDNYIGLYRAARAAWEAMGISVDDSNITYFGYYAYDDKGSISSIDNDEIWETIPESGYRFLIRSKDRWSVVFTNKEGEVAYEFNTVYYENQIRVMSELETDIQAASNAGDSDKVMDLRSGYLAQEVHYEKRKTENDYVESLVLVSSDGKQIIFMKEPATPLTSDDVREILR